MSNTPLNIVTKPNYLVIRPHHALSWELHVNYVCSKANQLFGNVPTQIKEHLYKQLLLPSIDICLGPLSHNGDSQTRDDATLCSHKPKKL